MDGKTKNDKKIIFAASAILALIALFLFDMIVLAWRL
jgi:hypothetical protein